MGADARLTELNLTLPPAPKPVATYRPAVQMGDLLYVSGHGPLRPDGSLHLGKLGAGLDLEAGHARRPADRPGDPGDRPVSTGDARPGRPAGQGSGPGQQRPGLHRSSQGHQRLLRPDGRGLRRVRPGCPERPRRGGPARRDGRRGRGDLRGQGLTGLGPADGSKARTSGCMV